MPAQGGGPAAEIEVEVEHRTVTTDGVPLHVVSAGPADGPPVILLHGFPEFWYGWRRQLPALAAAGYRVWAPDQRGYNRSGKPAGVGAYRLDALAADVAALVGATDHPRATLVGHDWGGVVAWWTALVAPELVDRLVAINAPHPTAYRRLVARDPRQALRSWYVLAFQLPRLPEFLLRRRNWWPLATGLRATSRPGTFTDRDLDRYRAAWSRPGALTGMLNWYRAALRYQPAFPADPRVSPPTLVVWGVRDPWLRPVLARRSVDLCRDGRLEVVDGATHWVQHEAADRVNALLDGFLSA